MNLVENAISNGELEKFIFGQEEYFLPDKENGELWVLGLWLYHIIPYMEKHGDICLPEIIFEKLIKEKSYKYDIIDLFFSHLYNFVYLVNEKRIEKDCLTAELKIKINNYIENIIENTKGEYNQSIHNSINIIIKKGGEWIINISKTRSAKSPDFEEE